jgi:hypothetical protein
LPDALQLTEGMVTGLTYIEQIYWLEGAIPSHEKIADVVGVKPDTVKKWFAKKDFVTVLRGKGLPMPQEEVSGVLSPSQLMLVNMLLNLSDRRSDREKLEAAGVTPQQYAMWRRDNNFLAYLHKRAEQQFGDASDEASQGLLKNVKAGDLSAIKFYYEVTGRYNPRLQVDVNVDSVMNRVVEIIQKHVRDPQVLMAIADDLEDLANGKPRDTPEPVVKQVVETTAVPMLGLDHGEEVSLNLG